MANRSCVLLLLCCTWCRNGGAAEPPLRVFYSGHSFHMFVPKKMAEYTQAAGIKAYQELGRQTLSASVSSHWALPDEKNPAKSALKAGNVDVFTMSPHLPLPDAGIERYVELGLKHHPQMRFLVQQSWIPWELLQEKIADNADRDRTDLDRLKADHAEWRRKLERQVQAIHARIGREAVVIAPVGDAVVRLRELVAAGKVPGITKQSELFNDRIGHGKPPLVVLTAYCNYACLTGRDPHQLPADPSISAELDALLKDLAWSTVEQYPFSGIKTSP